MRTKLTILAGILAFSATLQANTSYTSYTLNTVAGSSGGSDGSYAISPYSGSISGVNLQLYCVDFNDTVTLGSSYSVYVTALTSNTTAAMQQNTRYGVDNPSSGSSTLYPSGSTLYEEMAWLATQMQHTSSSTQDKALQEAMWQLTDISGGAAAPNSSNGNSGSASSGLSGTSQSAAKWIQDAHDYVAGFNATTGASSWNYAYKYEDLILSDWYILTAVNSAGCTVGSHTGGCTPGTAGTGNATQEFLAYRDNGGLVTSTTNSSGGAVPEPATFVLIGSGLLAGVMVRRRKKA